MDDAFLGSEPTQLRVAGERPPEAGEIRPDVLERAADHERREGADCLGANLVATADRECKPVAFDPGVGLEDDVRGGVVRVWMHRIGPRARARRGKAQIDDFDVADDHGAGASTSDDTESAENTEKYKPLRLRDTEV